MSNWQILNYAEVGSTNDIAKELSSNPPAQRFVVTAQRQTAGRGRRGRSWQSEEGNLFLSQVFPCELEKLTEAVFVVSLSLFEAIAAFSPQGRLQIKWPNDILLENHKVSGILLEKGENGCIIAGIGVNLGAAPQNSSQMLYKAACLAQFGITQGPDELLQAYLAAFDKNESIWQGQGFGEIREKWLSHLKGLHEEITVNLDNGVEIGILDGISNQGALLLRQSSGLRKILAGDIFYKKEQDN